MRIFVMFDLPTKKKEDRKTYAQFRKWLLKNGYEMLQYSVYCKICNGVDNANMNIARLSPQIPTAGSVRSLIVTDRQYGNMRLHIGPRTARERMLNAGQLSFF